MTAKPEISMNKFHILVPQTTTEQKVEFLLKDLFFSEKHEAIQVNEDKKKKDMMWSLRRKDVMNLNVTDDDELTFTHHDELRMWWI